VPVHGPDGGEFVGGVHGIDQYQEPRTCAIKIVLCQTVAVEAEADAVKPDPLVCEDQVSVKTTDREIGLTRADL
jgi:hypothetical protein